MTSPRPHLRLVGGTHRGDGPDFEPVDRPVHDLHGAYRERDDARLDDDDADADDDLGEIIDADFARPAGSRSDADVDGDTEAPPNALQPRFVVAALIVFQLLAALGYAGKYAELVRGEGVYVLAALLSAPAAASLVVGAALLVLRPGAGRALFVFAAVAFGLAVPAWGIQYGWTWPVAFGSMLGLAGAWCARAEAHPAEHEQAQV